LLHTLGAHLFAKKPGSGKTSKNYREGVKPQPPEEDFKRGKKIVSNIGIQKRKTA